MKRKYAFLLAAALILAAGASSRALAASVKTISENAESSLDALDSKLTLFFRDAETGLPLSTAAVTLEGTSETTDAAGKVTFPFPKVSQEDDQTVVAEVSKTGYVPTKVPLLFRLGMIFDSHYSISPAFPPDNLRVVLDWSEHPDDLDAHLIKQGAYHISYRDTHDVSNEAALDHDAMHGLGPETITIKHVDADATFEFFVHDYSDRGDPKTTRLGQSRAHVAVYGENRLLSSFQVPAGAGNHWTVFFLRGGQIVPASALGSKPLDAPPAAP